MTEETGQTRLVAEFVCNTQLSDIPQIVVDRAKLHILDTIGVGVAALGQPAAKSLEQYARSLGGEPIATMMGAGGYKTSAPVAALVNGCLVNMIDFDNHTPTFVLPAVLAVGEMVGASGSAVLEAFILAVEASNRLDEVIEHEREALKGPTYRGWYHVGLLGSIGAALGAAKLLGLDVLTTQGALGTATCSAGGVRKNLGAKSKSLFSGTAASTGVTAALLAKAGITGHPEILEGFAGLIRTACLPGEYSWSHLDHLGNPYVLAGPLPYKWQPSVGTLQRTIEGLSAAKANATWAIADIEAIEAKIAFQAPSALTDTELGTFDYPTNELSSNFSWPYVIAATLIDGSFPIDRISEAGINDPQIKELVSKMTLELMESPRGAETIIHLRNGETVHIETPKSRKGPEPDEVIEKFRSCSLRSFPAKGVKDLEQQVMHIDELAGITELTSAFAG